ncbi:protein of unknown function [Ruminococcaceae bacterium BL-6]|nr:protein of unknown function [Ruminococcaceae bacterium BL-6]
MTADILVWYYISILKHTVVKNNEEKQ